MTPENYMIPVEEGVLLSCTFTHIPHLLCESLQSQRNIKANQLTTTILPVNLLACVKPENETVSCTHVCKYTDRFCTMLTEATATNSYISLANLSSTYIF